MTKSREISNNLVNRLRATNFLIIPLIPKYFAKRIVLNPLCEEAAARIEALEEALREAERRTERVE